MSLAARLCLSGESPSGGKQTLQGKGKRKKKLDFLVGISHSLVGQFTI